MEKIEGEITNAGLSPEYVRLLAKFRSIVAEQRNRTGQEPAFLLEHIEAVIRETASKF